MGNNVSSLLNVTMNNLALKPKLFVDLIAVFSTKSKKTCYLKIHKFLSEMLIKTSSKYAFNIELI